MVYSLLEVESLARVLPAALMLTADRALLATGFGRASGPMTSTMARRPFIVRARQAFKGVFTVRGVNRRMTVLGALRHLGIRGLAGATRDLALMPLRKLRVTRPEAVKPHGPAVSAAGNRLEHIPVSAAAIMAGVLGFLDDLPACLYGGRSCRSAER